MLTLDQLNGPLLLRASALPEGPLARCAYCGQLGHTSHCSCGRPNPCLACTMPEARRTMVQVPRFEVEYEPWRQLKPDDYMFLPGTYGIERAEPALVGRETAKLISATATTTYSTITLADPTNFEVGDKVTLHSGVNAPADAVFLRSKPAGAYEVRFLHTWSLPTHWAITIQTE